MPDPITGLIAGGATIIGGMMQADAAGDAADAQQAASAAGIAEQRRQFDKIQELLQPYVQAGVTAMEGLSPYTAAGVPALDQQMALLGLKGAAAERAAIQAIEHSPAMAAMIQQGENAILQNASATGGLRGGNVQAALAQFRPQLLAQEIERRYGRLGGLSATGATIQQNLAQLGQASAAQQASSGMTSAANIANLMQQGGAAQAGASLAQGQAYANMLNMIPRGIGMYYGLTGSLPWSKPAASPMVLGGGF